MPWCDSTLGLCHCLGNSMGMRLVNWLQYHLCSWEDIIYGIFLTIIGQGLKGMAPHKL